MRQRTISKSLRIEGSSLFNNGWCEVHLHPDKPNTGISYIFNGSKYSVGIGNLFIEPVRTTSLQFDGYTVRTIEHLHSALYGLMIDNIIIETFSDSIPDIKGDKLINFGQLLFQNGITDQDCDAKYIAPSETEFSFEDSRVFISELLNNELIIEASITFPLPIGTQTFVYNSSADNYLEEISWARTFLRTDIKTVINHNPYLIANFNPEGEVFWDYITKAIKGLPDDPLNSDVLCYRDDNWVNEPYKFDEPVRHKILDILGDLSLLNSRLTGHFKFIYPGHSFNQALCNMIEKNYR